MNTNRRMFLTGTGGAFLAIPFLPSLLTRAYAAEPDFGAPPKCFFSVATTHGEVWGKNMYPDDSLLTQTIPYAGRDVRFGALNATPDANGDVVWSAVCKASSQALTPALAAKFNILRGLDIPYRIAHHSGGNLGNFAGTVGTTVAGLDATKYLVPTIDQLMAYSTNFYSEDDLNSRMTQNAFSIGNVESGSYNYAAPVAKAGNIIRQKGFYQNQDLFDYLFDPGAAYHGIDQLLIDRVKGRYDALKSDPRISVGDLQRLNQHVEMMFEVERKIKVCNALSNVGELPSKPTFNSDAYWKHHSFPHDPDENKLYCHLMNDITVMAFNSGVSRVATWCHNIHFTEDLINDWHGQVAHSGLGATKSQAYVLGYNQGTFEHILVDLASKLDAVSLPNGGTLLDNSLLMQTNEGGQITHHSGCVNYPVVTAGGAGGYFNTGKFVDFGNTNHTFDDMNDVLTDKPGLVPEHPGLYYNQFLANALMSMGLPKEEWETFTEFTVDGPDKSTPTKGYGFHYVDADRASHYEQAKLVMSDKLPVITNG